MLSTIGSIASQGKSYLMKDYLLNFNDTSFSDESDGVEWLNSGMLLTNVGRFDKGLKNDSRATNYLKREIRSADKVALSKEFSLSFFIYPTATDWAGRIFTIGSTGSDSKDSFRVFGASGYIRASYYDNGSGNWKIHTNITNIPVNQWTYIVIRRKGSTFNVVVNGSQSNGSMPSSMLLRNVVNLYVGGAPSELSIEDAIIDDLKVSPIYGTASTTTPTEEARIT